MHATANHFKFKPILKLTWSCIHPQLTEKQQAERQKKIENKNIFLYSIPVGICGMCASCKQRAEDGFIRKSTS